MAAGREFCSGRGRERQLGGTVRAARGADVTAFARGWASRAPLRSPRRHEGNRACPMSTALGLHPPDPRRRRAGGPRADRALRAGDPPRGEDAARDPRLSSQFDWRDICQSVLASFFLRAASGQYDLDQPDQLLRLLVVMTRHKLSKQERRHRADKRDYRRAGRPATRPSWRGSPAPTPSPSRLVAGRELLEAVPGRFSEEERMLADLRAQGCEWAEICDRYGGTPAGTSHATGPRGRPRRCGSSRGARPAMTDGTHRQGPARR